MDEIIDDIYVTYISSNRDMKELMKYTNKSRPTINKYIFIKENLDDELFRLFKTKKITIAIAEYLSKWIRNHDIQRIIFPQLEKLKTPQKKELILKQTSCMICCTEEGCILKEHLPCCNNSICYGCMISIISSCLEGASLNIIKCPFCREILPYELIKSICRIEELWRYNYRRKFKVYETRYKVNLLNIYKNMIMKIVNNSEPPKPDTLQIIDKKMETSHYGHCLECIERVYVNEDRFKYITKYSPGNMFLKNVHIAEVQKECINVDVDIKSDLFKCVVCKDKHENPMIKKCPHCGIKTLQPDGCNYVRCECFNRWCFVCNYRLTNDWNGHNAHYYIGQGSSAYDYACRVSVNHSEEKYTIDNCTCEYCQKRSGKPLCSNIECNEMVDNGGILCSKCI